jgi:transcriptional regulator with XRE-family HTH domain
LFFQKGGIILNIGDRIKIRRETLGLSLEVVANHLKVHRSTVMRYENGETQRISLSTIEKLAVILDTTTEQLMGWEAKPTEATIQDPEFVSIARMMRHMSPDKKEMLIKIAKTMSDIADEELTK